jgi:hypothetical protein
MRELECWGLSVRTLRGSDGKKAGRLPHGRLWLCAFATLLCAVALLASRAAAARDLVVYGEPILQKALKSVGSLWQARTGTRVNVFVVPTDLSYAQIDRGGRCDVIFALAGVQTRGMRSLPPAEVAIASILAFSLWALQTRSWRRPKLLL